MYEPYIYTSNYNILSILWRVERHILQQRYCRSNKSGLKLERAMSSFNQFILTDPALSSNTGQRITSGTAFYWQRSTFIYLTWTLLMSQRGGYVWNDLPSSTTIVFFSFTTKHLLCPSKFYSYLDTPNYIVSKCVHTAVTCVRTTQQK